MARALRGVGERDGEAGAPGRDAGPGLRTRPVAVGPRFHVLERQRVRPVSWVLALVVAGVVAWVLHAGLRHRRGARLREDGVAASRAGGGRAGAAAEDDDDKDDDPNQVDVIALGDPADAPEPAAARRGHGGRVHPTILVKLPRFGPEEGLIPSTAAGHLLYGWMAAFHQGSAAAMAAVLPAAGVGETADDAAAAQMELRVATGGLRLLSAKEVAPGVLVFRMRDQTEQGREVLGTLVMQPGVDPPRIQSFSLRGVGD